MSHENQIKFYIKLFALFLFLAGVPVLFAYCDRGNHENRKNEIVIAINKAEKKREGEEKLWQLKKDNSGYKNQTLKTIQDTIKKEWKTEEWKIPIFISFIYSENGTLSPNHKARDKKEKSYGLCQCNPKYRNCEPIGDFDAQLRQCLDWFISYTENSTRESIYRDIRVGHNYNGGVVYEKKIKNTESLFILH